ncbi:hypothetical protein LCM4579_27320 [Ensifer sp. LCM 4579]|nr:hypothetical protein LCM4579_27320 [Ensifer sp. LCM 4579]
MQFTLEASDVALEDLQSTIDAALIKLASDDSNDIRKELGPDAVAALSRPEAFEASRGKEGFGAVELVLIAAAGRLLASVPERLVVRIFDEYVWPRLQSRFGSAISRAKDQQ